ncbi:MAG: hypothetical protein HYR88_16730 [Verrucomicrobia bacterium]|nr:hypothetical protein [Verrucomicrobiota bacterium]MBI3866991.1 hypothetical protein [Verrucomicrobiota bacterium]
MKHIARIAALADLLHRRLPFGRRLVVALLAAATAWAGASQTGSAQTATEWVQTGRALLTTSNLPAASAAFAQAIQKDPTLDDANALHAATRVLLIYSLPAVSNLLTRLGEPTQGRNLHHWTAAPPRDAEGRLALPPAVSTAEITETLRSSVLPELVAAELELARITNSSFLLRLTAGETKLSAVDVDYGDVLMLRAILKALAFWTYTIHSWDLDAPARVLSRLGETPGNTAEEVLARYPSLLTFATTNDMTAGRAAFSSMVDLYVAATTRIFSRLPSETRLFNTDSSESGASIERDVRFLLQDLQASLSQPTLLRASPPLRAQMDRMFAGKNSIRSFLPEFQGNIPTGGTLPDPTFGGFLLGLDPADVPYSIKHKRNAGHRIQVTRWIPGAGVRLDVNGIPGVTYEVVAADDLAESLDAWLGLGTVFPADGHSVFLDPGSVEQTRRFYALLPSSRPQNDDFQNRLPLHGASAIARGWNDEATTEPGEPDHGFNGFNPNWSSIWWSWTAPRSGPVVIDSCSGSYPQVDVYTGAKLSQLTLVGRSGDDQNVGCRVEFMAEAGVVYAIAAGQPFGPGGSVRLQLTQLATSANTSIDSSAPIQKLGSLIQGTDSTYLVDDTGGQAEGLWWNWTAPATGRYWITRDGSDDNHLFSILAQDALGELQFIGEGGYSVAFDAVQGGKYFILSTREDGGNTVAFRLQSIAGPRNDEPSLADPIVGDQATLVGSNAGATVSTSEPVPQGPEATVWWRFTAPANGFLTIEAFRSDFDVDLSAFQQTGLELTSTPWSWSSSGSFGLSVSSGKTYYMRAGGWDGEWGRIVLHTRFNR